METNVNADSPYKLLCLGRALLSMVVPKTSARRELAQFYLLQQTSHIFLLPSTLSYTTDWDGYSRHRGVCFDDLCAGQTRYRFSKLFTIDGAGARASLFSRDKMLTDKSSLHARDQCYMVSNRTHAAAGNSFHSVTE